MATCASLPWLRAQPGPAECIRTPWPNSSCRPQVSMYCLAPCLPACLAACLPACPPPYHLLVCPCLEGRLGYTLVLHALHVPPATAAIALSACSAFRPEHPPFPTCPAADPCATVVCAPPGVCEAGPGTCAGGACSYPAAPAGTPCPGGACDGAKHCTPGKPLQRCARPGAATIFHALTEAQS